jgi:site-specific recombinase XerD
MARHYCKDWLTNEEIQQFMSVINNSEHKLLFKTLYGMALRVSEALNIKVSDVNLTEGVVKLWDTKTASFQVGVIPNWLIGDMAQHIECNNLKNSDKLFKITNRTYVWMLAKDYAQKARLNKEISTHTFRRSRALNLLNKGMALEKVSKFLRHKNISTTMEYLNITVDDIKQDLKRIGDDYDL